MQEDFPHPCQKAGLCQMEFLAWSSFKIMSSNQRCSQRTIWAAVLAVILFKVAGRQPKAVCQSLHFHFNQNTGLQGHSLSSHSHLEITPEALPVSWLNASSFCFESLLKGNICFSMDLIQFPWRQWDFCHPLCNVSNFSIHVLAASHISVFKHQYVCILWSFLGALEIELLRLAY